MAKLSGFNLELVDTPDGPLLSLGDPECRGLCRLANAMVTGEVPDLVERLKRDETVELDGARAGRPPASLDLRQTREGFIERTGRDPDEEGGLVVVDGEPYPIYTFEDLGAELQSARDQFLRRRKRAEKLHQQEQRAAAITRADWTRESLDYLESQAVELERLEADPASSANVDAAATVSVKRRFLLLELYAHGLLEDQATANKLADLERWSFPTLAGWLRAAVEHAQYQRSPERAELAPDEPIRPVLFSPISLDWFRKPTPIPPKVVVNRLKWTAWCERQAADSFERGEMGTSGWWIWHSGSVTHTFYWRYENGETPVLYKVT